MDTTLSLSDAHARDDGAMLTAIDEVGGACTSVTSLGYASGPGILLHLARLLRWQLRRHLHKRQERVNVNVNAALLLQCTASHEQRSAGSRLRGGGWQALTSSAGATTGGSLARWRSTTLLRVKLGARAELDLRAWCCGGGTCYLSVRPIRHTVDIHTFRLSRVTLKSVGLNRP